jgi:multicomponent Na+:H+ antiporter subunit D
MRGIGRRMPVTTFAFFLGSLSVIGLPPCGGSWSKWFLALGAADAHQAIFVGVLMVSSLLNILYLMPIVVNGFFAAGDGESGVKEAPLFCVVPLSFTALAGIALFFFADDVYRVLLPIVQP